MTVSHASFGRATPRWCHSVLAGALAGLAAISLSLPVAAFDSGSTGADGAFAPSVSTRLPLPEDGVLNFTTVDIPAGVTVTFERNTTNTPVVILASGNVTINGVINVNGGYATNVGAAGNGNIGDDGLPGLGGPGGYGGGVGGRIDGNHAAGRGLGPGGGGYGGVSTANSSYRTHGGGGSFGSAGGSSSNYQYYNVSAGSTYGSSLLLPLVGGSGGGGGAGGNAFAGSGGGGGGGALLIATSGTLSVNGGVYANGGRAGQSAGSQCGTVGGGGSGGAIRLVATTIQGNGAVSAAGGSRRDIPSCSTSGYTISTNTSYMHWGGGGRIRLEAETITRTAASNPAHAFGQPGDLFIAGLPTLRISQVAGVDAPLNPTGVADVQLPADTPNPVTVELEATGIPLGNIVKLTVIPAHGGAISAVSNALDGVTELATASASINLPQGPSTLIASITYTLVAGVDDARLELFERIAGEPVEGLRIEAALGGDARYVLITRSGREVAVPRAALAAG